MDVHAVVIIREMHMYIRIAWGLLLCRRWTKSFRRVSRSADHSLSYISHLARAENQISYLMFSMQCFPRNPHSKVPDSLVMTAMSHLQHRFLPSAKLLIPSLRSCG